MPAGTAYCIPEGMLGPALEIIDLDGDGTPDHVRLTIRNQFLHPEHPLGWIRRLAVSLDEEEMPTDAMHFVLRDQWVAVDKLRTVTDIWWHMREVAEIYIPGAGLSAGRHRVDVVFDVSLFVHTPSVDRLDQWPTLRQQLTSWMDLA